MLGKNDAPIKGAVDSGKTYGFELKVLTLLFFMWGFLTCLNDILIPHLKAVFSLNYTEAMLIQFCFFAAYFLMSLPSGSLVEKIGYKKSIIGGLSTAAIGCLMFYPAASVRSYPMFLLAFFILASGITLLQVAANPYVTVLGRPETASSRLNLTQAFNSLGTTIAPLFGSVLILSVSVLGAGELGKMNPMQLSHYQEIQARTVQIPYLGLSAALFIIAGIFAAIKLPDIEAEGSPEAGDEHSDHGSAWGYRHLILGALGIFLYVGAEVSIGSFLVNYLGQKFVMGLKEADAGKFVALYWGGAMVGRFFGSGIQRIIKPGKMLAFNAMAAALLVITSMLTNGVPAMFSILAVGLFNSVMFPTIFSLALSGLGKHTGQGSGILCMGIVGGAILPVIQGALADNPAITIHHAFILPVFCYLFIAYYGLVGHRPACAK